MKVLFTLAWILGHWAAMNFLAVSKHWASLEDGKMQQIILDFFQ